MAGACGGGETGDSRAMTRDLPKPRRSALYIPASNARAIEKARSLPCDCLIFDLEDAVAESAKDSARAALVTALAEGGFGARERIVRINGLDTPWGADDVAALREAGADALLLPKIAGTADIRQVDAALEDAPPKLALWVMIETCAAALDLAGTAALAADTRLAGLVLGLNDLAKEMRAPLSPGRVPFLPILTQAVLAARASGLILLDGVWTALDDLDGFAAECAQGAAFGFDGKTLIHPDQIAPCNRAFSPSEEALAQARAIVLAFADPANQGKGALRVEGRMVEALHLEEARRLLAIDAAVQANSSVSIST